MLKLEEYINDPSKLRDLSPEELLQVMRMYSAWRHQNRSGLPQSAIDAMTAAVDDKLMREIVADSKRTNEPGWFKREERREPVFGSKGGWAEAQPMDNSIPGIKYVDQLCDAQDAIDKRELVKRLKG